MNFKKVIYVPYINNCSTAWYRRFLAFKKKYNIYNYKILVLRNPGNILLDNLKNNLIFQGEVERLNNGEWSVVFDNYYHNFARFLAGVKKFPIYAILKPFRLKYGHYKIMVDNFIKLKAQILLPYPEDNYIREYLRLYNIKDFSFEGFICTEAREQEKTKKVLAVAGGGGHKSAIELFTWSYLNYRPYITICYGIYYDQDYKINDPAIEEVDYYETPEEEFGKFTKIITQGGYCTLAEIRNLARTEILIIPSDREYTDEFEEAKWFSSHYSNMSIVTP